MAKGREAISAKVFASALEMLGTSRVMYFDVHAAAIQGFFNIPVDPLSAFPTFAEYFQSEGLAEDAVDLLDEDEKNRLLSALKVRFREKELMAISAKKGEGMDALLEFLLSSRPGANTVLRQIDYDRYATAEAVLGWLNAAVKIKSSKPFDSGDWLHTLASTLQEDFKKIAAEIGHLKFVITSAGKSMWGNVTRLTGEPSISSEQLGSLASGTLLVNARVRIEPGELETIVRDALKTISRRTAVTCEIYDLQCFSPAYPEPPHIIRDPVPGL